MGKTVTSLLTIAAAGVLLYTGAGAGLATALVNSGLGITAAGATAIIQGVIVTGVISAVSGIGSLLGLGTSTKPETTETTIKSARPPRVSAYGRSRLYGNQALYMTTDGGLAIDVFAVHDGKIDGIEARYLTDDAVTLSGNFVVKGSDGRYGNNKIRFDTTDGSSPGVPFWPVVTLVPDIWTANHRGDGVVAMSLICWPVGSEYFSTVYPSSAPPAPSIVARWQLCPDPSAADPLDESGWTWTENPVRHLLHYMLVREGPRPSIAKSNAGYAAALLTLRQAWWARKIAPSLDFWIVAAEDCDSTRTLKDGTTEARYRSCVSHKHTDTHQAVKSAILATFDGWMATRADGAYIVYSGRYYAPTVTIGPDEIVTYTWEGGGVDDDDAVNHLVCSYIAADSAYAVVECDPWRDEEDISRRGEELSDNQDAAVPSWAQSRYLAKRKMARKNAVNRGSVTTNIAGRAARGERFIWLRLIEGNTTFYDGPAEITSLSRTLGGGVTFEWVAADPNVDEWNPATEEGEPAATGEVLPQSALSLPTITSAAAIFDGAAVRLQLEVEGASREDLTWYAHWRLAGASVWGADESYSNAGSGSDVVLNTGIVSADSMVEVQVAYLVSDGRLSDWSETSEVDTSTASLAPSAVTSLSASNGTGSAVITWRNPTSTNLGYVRLYRSATSSFSGAAQIGGDIAGGLGEVMSYTYTGATGTHYFWARPYSVDNVPGALAGPASATIS